MNLSGPAPGAIGARSRASRSEKAVGMHAVAMTVPQNLVVKSGIDLTSHNGIGSEILDESIRQGKYMSVGVIGTAAESARLDVK